MTENNVVYMTGRGWTKDATPELDESLKRLEAGYYARQALAGYMELLSAVMEFNAAMVAKAAQQIREG